MLICLCCAVAGFSQEEEKIDFVHDVAPVLKKHCGKCHLGEKKKGGFSMNSRASLLEGSENGPVLEEGKAKGSYFIDILETDDKEVWMPPKGDRVSAEEIAVLKKWIDAGLPWDEGFSFGEGAWEPPLKPQKGFSARCCIAGARSSC